jgi:RecB family exonuclease
LGSIQVRNYEDLNDLEKLSLVDFSYSRIDTYNYCPAKYFYSYIDKQPRGFAPHAALGNIIHTVLENSLDNDKQLDIDLLKQEYANNIPVYDPNSLIDEKLIDAGNVMIDDFFDLHHDTEFNIFAKELEFSFVIGSYLIRGFIDRVDLQGDTVTIVDYKTGSKEVANKDVENNIQLGIYALAVSRMFPDKKIKAFLYYLRSGRYKGLEFTPEKLEDIKQNIIDSIYKIINDTNYKPTPNARQCNWCDHAKSGACATGAYRISNNQ